ncbi:MAG: tyrosine-type recombinase/integrase [Oligoflexia bacterium]|nr:tyrosine-type recombinase/integrase [Oligoflexia bacterium]
MEIIELHAINLKMGMGNNEVLEFLVSFLSPNTRKAYKRDLALFSFFLQKKYPQTLMKEASTIQLAIFREYLLKSYSARTARRVLDSLGSYYQFLKRKKVIALSPMDEIDRPKCSKEILTPDVTNQEVLSMLNAVDLTKQSGPLHRAVLSLFFYTGLRCEEVRMLKIENIHVIHGQLAMVFRGKGDKERIVPMPPPLQKDLGRYLKKRSELGTALNSSSPLFCSSTGKEEPLSPRAFSYIVKNYAIKANISETISVHSTRATFIGASLDAGIPLDKVADLVGHQDVNLTRRYSKRRNVLNTFDKLPDLYQPEEKM